MALFGKKQDKFYLVVDVYSGEVIASCNTKETKQISQVQVKARFVEASEYEIFKFNEHGVVPEDISKRKACTFKEL